MTQFERMKMEVEALGKEDIDEIKELLHSLGDPDIYFDVEYLDLFSRYMGWDWIYLRMGEGDGLVLEPYHVRDIEGSDGKDLISPWYFGGPLFGTEDVEKKRELSSVFRKGLRSFTAEEGIVSEFVRFHPLMENHAGLEEEKALRMHGKVVVVDLKPSMEEIRASYRKRARKSIRKATPGVFNDDESLSVFIRIYQEAMLKKGADFYYHFNENFFRELSSIYSDSIMLMSLGNGQSPRCATMALGRKPFLHDYLRGRDPDGGMVNTDHLMVDHLIEKGKEAGYEWFLMGGGRGNGEDDTLLRFKRGFSRDLREFFILKYVHDKEEYDRLSRMRGIETPLYERAEFFPEYRMPERGGRGNTDSS